MVTDDVFVDTIGIIEPFSQNRCKSDDGLVRSAPFVVMGPSYGITSLKN